MFSTCSHLSEPLLPEDFGRHLVAKALARRGVHGGGQGSRIAKRPAARGGAEFLARPVGDRTEIWGNRESLRPARPHGTLGRTEQTFPFSMAPGELEAGSMPASSFINQGKSPPCGGAVPVSGFALRAAPDQVVVAFGLARPQSGVDRGVEARIVDRDGDVELATSMAVEEIGDGRTAPSGRNIVEDGRERLSCPAQNGGGPGSPFDLSNGVGSDKGRKLQTGVAGGRLRRSCSPIKHATSRTWWPRPCDQTGRISRMAVPGNDG
jgi:hypothetical protein